MRLALDPPAQRLGLPLEPVPPLRPPRVLFPLGTGVARVRAQVCPQPGQLSVVGGRGAALLPRAEVGCDPRIAQAGRQIPAGLRRTVVEVLRYSEASQYLHRRREVRRTQPPGPALLGQHQRSWLTDNGAAGIQYHRQPLPPPGGDADDIART